MGVWTYILGIDLIVWMSELVLWVSELLLRVSGQPDERMGTGGRAAGSGD